MSRSTVRLNRFRCNLLEKRFEIFKTPSFGIPMIVVGSIGSSIHHEIDASSSSKHRRLHNSTMSSINIFARFRCDVVF
jgi:hypothetical protein